MRIGVAEARRRFREILDRVDAGEVVEISRRGEVVATIASPSPRRPSGESFGEALHRWREAWKVDDWPEDDPFADVRDRSPGRGSPW
ncbi:MAG: type II toxin-antitoxin system Phd/YefM family antitoxin [Pseudonocardia sp.]